MTNLNEDITLAQQIVSRKKLPSGTMFSDISGLYRTTNEYISSKNYLETIKDKERILSVIGSGDQIINSILLGSTDIEGYDISRFPKYYLKLKLAALKSLSKKEYLNFFMGDIHNEIFNEDTYSKIVSNLDEESNAFWDSLFDYFDPVEINESLLFRTEITNKKITIDNNPYLQDDNYEIVKSKINGINIKFHMGSIFNIINSDMKGFDLVNLSNIINYIKLYDMDYKDYQTFIKNIPLNDNGVVLTYLMNYYNFWKKSGILNMFNDDEYNKIPLEESGNYDGLLLYKKISNNKF